MSGPSSVPAIEREGLQDVVLGWASDESIGYSEIARRLRDEYALDLTPVSIRTWLERQRDNRRMAQAQAVATDPDLLERMRKSATSDLDMADSVLATLYEHFSRVDGFESRVSLGRAIFDGLRTKSKLTGVDAPGAAASASVAVSVVAGGVGRLRDMSEEELAQLLSAESVGSAEEPESRSSIRDVDGEPAGGQPGERATDEGEEQPEGAGGGAQAFEGEAASTEGRRREPDRGW